MQCGEEGRQAPARGGARDAGSHPRERRVGATWTGLWASQPPQGWVTIERPDDRSACTGPSVTTFRVVKVIPPQDIDGKGEKSGQEGADGKNSVGENVWTNP